ncbi:MAG: hypothetical protein E7616_01085 [Ruminococcaceae bacterium]|nr:hypothetical protein [Oscillospiraceae bacterium]
MLKEYYFYDAKCGDDIYEEYDIKDEAYKELLRLCFSYCDMVSFYIHDPGKIDLEKELEPYRIPVSDIKFDKHRYFDIYPYTRSRYRFYRLCPQLKELMENHADSIFEWLDGWGFHNPEDPAFYRSDGSVFFASVIHEGELRLTPREGEDITALLQLSVWWKDHRQHKRMYGIESDSYD